MSRQAEITKLIKETASLIVVNAKSLADAQGRASEFLGIQFLLINYLKDLEVAKAKQDALTTALYNNAFMNSASSTATEKKVDATSDGAHAEANIKLQTINAEIHWIKSNVDIFKNAHVLFRQYSRES